MKWTSNQANIIRARNCNLLVSAAAGSGKTAVLVERIIQMICDSDSPINIDELLVVTFTKAAATQMKDKIRQAIEQRLLDFPDDKHLQKQIYLLNQANILTIDSFCFRVIKENFHVVGIDPSIRVGETGEIELLKADVLEAVIEEAYENDGNFVMFADAFGGDKNDETIEKYITKIYDVSSSFPRPFEWTKQARKQLEVQSEEEFMQLVFVKDYFAQTGSILKTIREKITAMLELARMPDGPAFMERALLSDVEYVDALISAKNYSMLHDGTEHKFANIGRGKAGTFDPEIADRIKETRENYKKELKQILKLFALPFDVVLSQIQEQKGMLQAVLCITDKFREKFMEEKRKHNILEFSDVEHLALDILCEGYDEAGNPVPSRIGEEMADGFYEIMIDEYQDSNYLQEAILTCVSTISKGKNNLFMVGDVKQSIYSFRMARPDLFMDKYNSYPESLITDCQKHLLKNNFRSRANVLQGTNYIFSQIMGKDLGGIEYTEDEALVPSRDYPDYEADYVELLVGESKDFNFAKSEDVPQTMVAQKDEDLDENLEDIGRQELEATMVAQRIEKLFGKPDGNVYQVYDEKNDRMRDIEYRDIVILFRAPSGFCNIFEEVLSGYGIPVRVQNEKGYLDTVETRQILSLLRTLDNPYNEVELVAALRGYFGRFGEEDLAKLIIEKRKLSEERNIPIPLYRFLTCISNSDKDIQTFADKERELCKKTQKFVAFMDELREKQAFMGVSELVEMIYFQTGYFHYVQAMPQGEGRIRNLDLLLDEIRGMEGGAYCSVFDFLTYIDKILVKEITLGGDPGLESEENAVRIMSIHKSKGLEFPVVFVSGMGKQYNLQDTKVPLIVHSDYYIGAKYVNTRQRRGNDTFMRQCFSALMRTESISEELRILYVALTRAKEKLIMTGVTSDIPALIHKYAPVSRMKKEKLGFPVVNSTNGYLELVIAAFIRNRTFYETVGQIPKRMDAKNQETVDADYEFDLELKQPKFDLAVSFYDFRKLTVYHIQKGYGEEEKRAQTLEAFQNLECNYEKQICKDLQWEYSNLYETRQKTKLSVTEIKRIYEVDYDFSKEIIEEKKEDFPYVAPTPQFLNQERKLTAAQRGTLIHKVMELFDFAGIETKEDIKVWMESIDKKEILDGKIQDNLTIDKIYQLLQSGLGKRMKQAARNGKLYKEKQFVIGIPSNRLEGSKEQPDTQKIVVQGIIDAYFEEDDGIVLLDYKTDKITPQKETELKERYQTQLRLYKDTLEQLLEKPVKETYIYSFAIGKEIHMF